MADHYDIAIIGGGMIGLSLAVALSQAAFKVAIIELKTPALHWQSTDYDARVSAIHLGTHRFLKHLGVWSSLQTSAYSPLEQMCVWDVSGGGEIHFDAADISEEVLGYIVENREMVRVLWEYCQASDHVDVIASVKPIAITDNVLTLENNKKLFAHLIVGADGARSWVREQMETICIEKPYHHDALVAVIETEKPHRCVAYQAFLSQGPLGVLPLANPNHVAIVWSADPGRCGFLLNLSLDKFNRELQNALSSKLGKVQCLSVRKTIPLSERQVDHYVEKNRVLVGDAAHTIHPLAGQGANLGFMDVMCLANVLNNAKEKEENIGDYGVLRRYERERKSENELMMLIMSGFKSVFSSRSPLTVSARSWGFNAVNQFNLLKKYFMRFAVHQESK